MSKDVAPVALLLILSSNETFNDDYFWQNILLLLELH